MISLDSHYNRLDLSPSSSSSLLTLSDFPRSDSNLITDLQNAFKDGTTGNTALEGLSVLTRSVDIERTDANHVGWHSELSLRNGDTADVINDDVDVVFQNS